MHEHNMYVHTHTYRYYACVPVTTPVSPIHTEQYIRLIFYAHSSIFTDKGAVFMVKTACRLAVSVMLAKASTN